MLARVWYYKFDIRMGDDPADHVLPPVVIYVDAVCREDAEDQLKRQLYRGYYGDVKPQIYRFEILDGLEEAVLNVVENTHCTDCGGGVCQHVASPSLPE